jgi:hypothetical protein
MATGEFHFEYHDAHEFRNSINKKDMGPVTDKFPQQY